MEWKGGGGLTSSLESRVGNVRLLVMYRSMKIINETVTVVVEYVAIARGCEANRSRERRSGGGRN